MIQWRELFDGLYSISNTGIIKANKRVIQTKTGPRIYQQRVLIPEITEDGHLRITLSNAGQKKRYFIHRLVAQTFIPNPNNYPVINHKDENPKNNNVENLQWCSIAYNNAYNNRHQRIGDAQGHTVNIYNKEGFLKTYPSITKFAEEYNIPLTTAWRYIKSSKPINGLYVKQEDK